MIVELLTSRYPGMRLWLSQRLTAVMMASYLLIVVVVLLLLRPDDYIAWHDFAGHWLFQISTTIFFLCLLIHAWLGVRDVLRDYVFNLSMRAFLQIVVDLLLAAYLICFLTILWQL